ncbi:MAG: acyl-CoA dehydrogenase, partial [bacterium]
AAGRGISLPSLSVGAVKMTARATTAYGTVREQFGMPVGKFEGVQEPLARIAGFSYMMDATRQVTCGAIDEGQNPSVLSAVVKAYLTSNMRKCVNDGMDIFAGAAISKGQRNIFARPYNSIPIGITVEGANILTRSLIIFGQGAIRCHPFVQSEVEAIASGDVRKFDKAFFGHINHFMQNKTRAIIHGFTCGHFCKAPVRGYEAKYYKSLTRFSAVFAFATDVALLTLGGALKRKESLSGRYADALSYMYLASATLKKFNDRGRNVEERPLLDWAMAKALYETEEALIDICRNMPNRFIGNMLKFACFPYGATHHKPNDKQMHALINSISDESGEMRELISEGIYMPAANKQGLGAIESAYEKVLAAEPIRRKLKEGIRKGMLSKDSVINMATKAKEAKLISADEFKKIESAEKARLDVIQVNDFTPEQYNERR